MINQSYRHVFVANSSTLLASGTTVDLAVGQIGIVDANTYAPTTAPTYATNKAIILYQGMPDLNLPLMAGIPLTNQASKLMRGRRITKFRRKTASLGQNQIMSIGFDGIDITKNMTAKCGDKKVVFLRLTGNPIDKMYNSAPGQGLLREYWIDTGFCSDCAGDSCADVSSDTLADILVKKINEDTKLRFNNSADGAIVRARKVRSTALSTAGAISNTEYTVAIADAGDNAALAFIQAQYPGTTITRVDRTDIISTYKLIKLTSAGAPASFSNAGIYTLPVCAACPSGYTLNASGYLYKLLRADAGDATALTAVSTAYGISSAGESTVRVSYDATNAVSTYLLISNTASQAAIGSTDTVTNYGSVIGRCVLTSATTTAWVALTPVKYAFPQVYHITLKDTVCGVSRLAELQAAYPTLTITQEADGPVTCVHQYTTTIYSSPAALDCTSEQIIFAGIKAYGGADWTKDATVTPFTGQAGVVIETNFIGRITNELLFDKYPYEADTVHMQLSEGSEDYNGLPEGLYNRWPVTELQSVKYPQGIGARVRIEEIKSLQYFLKEWSVDPAVRDAEGMTYFTDPNALYDEYTIHFDFSYKVLGWSQTYSDSYQQVVYFKSGSGKAFEQAMLGYISSISQDIEVDLR